MKPLCGIFIQPAEPTVTESARAPGPGRRREASEERRTRILEAARDCFGELGFAGATVGEIARRAGVSNGLLYQFFRNKEHLFEVVLEEIIRDWVREMVPRDDDVAALDALEGMLRRSVAFCRTHPLLPALLVDDQDLQLSRIRGASRDRVQPHRDLVASILRRGVESGELRADLDVTGAADVICQLQSDYSGRAYRREPGFPDSDDIIDAAVDLIRHAVRA